MTIMTLGSVIGGGVPALVTPAGSAGAAMGAILIGLLALSALVILVADWRRAS